MVPSANSFARPGTIPSATTSARMGRKSVVPTGPENTAIKVRGTKKR